MRTCRHTAGEDNMLSPPLESRRRKCNFNDSDADHRKVTSAAAMSQKCAPSSLNSICLTVFPFPRGFAILDANLHGWLSCQMHYVKKREREREGLLQKGRDYRRPRSRTRSIRLHPAFAGLSVRFTDFTVATACCDYTRSAPNG